MPQKMPDKCLTYYYYIIYIILLLWLFPYYPYKVLNQIFLDVPGLKNVSNCSYFPSGKGIWNLRGVILQ